MPFKILGPEGNAQRKRSGHFPVPLHAPYLGQRSELDPQPVPRGWTDSALDISTFEPAGGHPEDVRRREDHGELHEA